MLLYFKVNMILQIHLPLKCLSVFLTNCEWTYVIALEDLMTIALTENFMMATKGCKVESWIWHFLLSLKIFHVPHALQITEHVLRVNALFDNCLNN